MMERCQVAVVGAGPVGLYVACALALRGVQVRVFERASTPSPRSRAIGIHPPGLRALSQIGVADALVTQGVRVERGLALADGRCLGQVSFAHLRGPHAYVLSVPQRETERLLEARLAELAPGALRRGHELSGLRVAAHGVELCGTGPHGPWASSASALVACDGKRSRVRELLGIPCRGAAYPFCFVMGDAPDQTAFAQNAVIGLHSGGLVESFPLPGQMRRWVAFTGRSRSPADPELLCALVRARAGVELAPESLRSVSAYQAEHQLAERFFCGPVILAGDAAHVVSPIGGQGMNLGFMDGELLAASAHAWLDPTRARVQLRSYDASRQRAVRRARLRSELFMLLARPDLSGSARAWLMKLMLSKPAAAASAHLFTMQCPRWPGARAES
jgi:2-polyprenyl-6-methoxyphenol hydroxylase-like FAD-dependent oxidoreductase